MIKNSRTLQILEELNYLSTVFDAQKKVLFIFRFFIKLAQLSLAKL